MTLVKFANTNRNSLKSFNNVFESLLKDTYFPERSLSSVPAVNIAETGNDFQIELAAPGLRKEDFRINLDKAVITISSDKKTEELEEAKKYNRREYGYNAFSRSFTLPESADHSKIDATYTDGILILTIGKREEAKIQARDIEVK